MSQQLHIAEVIPFGPFDKSFFYDGLNLVSNGDVVVTYGNKQVNLGNVGDKTNMTGARDLIFEWIRENKISVKGN